MTTTINMTRLGKPHPADPEIRYYLTLEEGKQAAIDVGLKEAVLKGPVDIRIPEERGAWQNHRETIKEAWVKGFVGPVAREVGIDLFMKMVTFNGGKIERNSWCGSGVLTKTRIYLLSEEKRLERDGEAKARKTGQTTWTDPGQFMIPDIGTVVRLTEDWTFRLIKEHRNDALTKQIGKGEFDWHTYGANQPKFLVTIKAGSELAVDRIYIRKGAESFSSITFHLHKGGELSFNGRDIKAKGRFWAKLSDVNKMKVQVDTITLAEN